MPELPEVETIANGLRLGFQDSPPLPGRRILSGQVFWERSIAEPGASEFVERIAGQVIESIGRRAKFLVFHLSQDHMLVHLRMSGDLRVESNQAPMAAHHRVILDLEGGLRLAFNDPRKFGRIWLTQQPEKIFDKLGPEPLDPDFTAEVLYRRLQATHRQLKPLLLDQSFIAGLGNIYTDEALFLSQLHPLQLSHTLTQEQAARLLESIRQVLQEGILNNGASIDWVYRGGGFQNHFRAYQRTGQACPRCGTAIQRITVGQRGSHFCPHCQPAMEKIR
jgi:formamidopyrimidine-DNA glycosylase